VHPLLDEAKFKDMSALAKEFEATSARKLNLLLTLKSWWSPNFVSDWWIKYVYLRSRSSLLLGSNYYGIDFAWHVPTNKQGTPRQPQPQPASSSRSCAVAHTARAKRVFTCHVCSASCPCCLLCVHPVGAGSAY
jgi:hypothetical protein